MCSVFWLCSGKWTVKKKNRGRACIIMIFSQLNDWAFYESLKEKGKIFCTRIHSACSHADYLQKALWRLTAISTAKDTTAIAVRIAVNRKSICSVFCLRGGEWTVTKKNRQRPCIVMMFSQLRVACSRLRDGGGKSFSNKKCEKRAGLGRDRARF